MSPSLRWALALLLGACTPHSGAPGTSPSPEAAGARALRGAAGTSEVTPEPSGGARAAEPLPRRVARRRLSTLPVEGYGPAVVSLPPPRARPYPLLVAAHGAGDFPEWHCELYGELVGHAGVVLCPRGRRLDARQPYDGAPCYFPDHHYLGAVVEASLTALFARAEGEGTDGLRLDPEGAVFAGYSQGATMGALIVARTPRRFARALLVEGGFGQWNVAIADRYRAGGGQRIALVCGGIGCALSAAESARWLEQGGVSARVIHVEGAGHTYGAAVAARLPEVLRWLVADDPRWRLDSP